MSVRPILIVPHEVLRATSRDVAIDKKTIEYATDLYDTLRHKTNPRGVGLSAPQIGKNWNMFATWLNDDPNLDASIEDLIIFINPVITDTSKEFTFGPNEDEPTLEGCLSIPTLYGPVPRHTWVDVSYTTLAGNEPVKKEGRFSDFYARVIQHEFDHLQGVLFTDYSLKYDLPVYEFIGRKSKEIDKTILKSF